MPRHQEINTTNNNNTNTQYFNQNEENQDSIALLFNSNLSQRSIRGFDQLPEAEANYQFENNNNNVEEYFEFDNESFNNNNQNCQAAVQQQDIQVQKRVILINESDNAHIEETINLTIAVNQQFISLEKEILPKIQILSLNPIECMIKLIHQGENTIINSQTLLNAYDFINYTPQIVLQICDNYQSQQQQNENMLTQEQNISPLEDYSEEIFDNQTQTQSSEMTQNFKKNNRKVKQQQPEKQKRIRERSIIEVLDSVQRYRKLFDNGLYNENIQSFQRLTLAQCAKIVGISKKSLDDYHLQIQKAKELNFDFSQCSDQKFGVVRRFIRNNAQAQAC